MLSVALPGDDAGTVFAACAARTQNAARRAALLAQRPHIEARAQLYLDRATEGSLYQLPRAVPAGIDAAELSSLYKRVLVDGGERAVYDRLRGLSRFARCPLCAQRDVRTLDHYLSKDGFPELAVFPANLVPSCFECNHAKGTYLAAAASQQLFHPYFDDWSAYRLVCASVEVDDGIAVDYSIRAPEGCPAEVVMRARRHFAELGLRSLYVQNAEVELAERKLQFARAYEGGGAQGLREELAWEERSRRGFNRNSWATALYRALSRCPDFIDDGFELIDD